MSANSGPTKTNLASTTAVNGVTGSLPIANGGTGATTKAAGFDALQPMTTSGDIIYGGASGTGTRLAKGSDGQFLTLASGLPSWSAVTATPPNSAIYLSGSLSHGVTGTAIRTYLTVDATIGSDITYTSDATNGDYLTINTAGNYSMSAWDRLSGSVVPLGFSKNQSNLTTDVSGLNYPERIIWTNIPSQGGAVSATVRCAVNDVIRVNTSGTSLSGFMFIVRVS